MEVERRRGHAVNGAGPKKERARVRRGVGGASRQKMIDGDIHNDTRHRAVKRPFCEKRSDIASKSKVKSRSQLFAWSGVVHWTGGLIGA
jgi:hypothetical protein